MQAGRDRDAVADDGKQTSDPGADFAVLSKEALRALQIPLAEKHVLAVALNQRPPDELGAVIVRERPDDAARDPAYQGDGKAQLSLRGPIPRRRHDQLTRHRQN